MDPERTTHPLAEGYYRARWAIHLFEQSQELLGVYRLFSDLFHGYAKRGDTDGLRAALTERYASYPNIDDIPQAVEDATEALIKGAELEGDIVVLGMRFRGSTEDDLLLERARLIADTTELEIIMSAYDWTKDGQNS